MFLVVYYRPVILHSGNDRLPEWVNHAKLLVWRGTESGWQLTYLGGGSKRNSAEEIIRGRVV